MDDAEKIAKQIIKDALKGEKCIGEKCVGPWMPILMGRIHKKEDNSIYIEVQTFSGGSFEVHPEKPVTYLLSLDD